MHRGAMGNYSIISSESDESEIRRSRSRYCDKENIGIEKKKIISNKDIEIINKLNIIESSSSSIINCSRIVDEGGRWNNSCNKKFSFDIRCKSSLSKTNKKEKNSCEIKIISKRRRRSNNFNNINNSSNSSNSNTSKNSGFNTAQAASRFLIILIVSSITIMGQLTKFVESSPTPSLKNQITFKNNDNNNNNNNNDNEDGNNEERYRGGADGYYNNDYGSIKNYDNYLSNELFIDYNKNGLIIDNHNDNDNDNDNDNEIVESGIFERDKNDDDDYDEDDDNENENEDDIDYNKRRNSKQPLDYEELDKIRKSIMEDLGLARIPDPSKANVSQTEYENAHREYLKRTELSKNNQERRTRRKLHVFYPADRLFDNRTTGITSNEESGYYNHNSLYFPVEIPIENHAVENAALRILIGVYGNENNRHPVDSEEIEVSIYQPTRSSYRRLIARRRVSVVPSAPRWAEFDSTEAVSSWVHGGEENLGLEVEISSGGWSAFTRTPAALNVFTISDARPVASRTRRATPDQLMSLHRGRRTECRGQNKKCCRHQMTVIFKDLKGFEFIIQPKDFDAGYCKGRCPPRYNPAHHHALLQSLIWKEDRKKAPRPCCAPSKLAELEILYFDENDTSKLKVSNWKNMKVLECACS